MRLIDRFAEQLLQCGAEQMVFRPSQPVYIYRNQEGRALCAGPSEDQLLELVSAACPDRRLAGEPGRFEYAAPRGRITICILRSPEGLQVTLAPVTMQEPELELVLESEAPSAAPAPSPAPAPPPPAATPPTPAFATTAGAPTIEALFRHLVDSGSSDLHLSSACPPMFRKDGEMMSGGGPPLSPRAVRAMLKEITPPASWEQFEAGHDTDFSYEIPDVARFRCNLFLDRKGMGGVFRVIPSIIPSAEQLGLPPVMLELCTLPRGLVLVTGPTGSGKSTTLAAMIDHINRTRSAHIITIEDPIEFVHENRQCLINQREVGPHTNGFKHALRAALREDPDIVLVGELRDLETVAIALETAETGHLVFGTLHTNSAPATVDRIIDQFSAGQQAQIRTMLSEALEGVISQTLCRRAGGGRVAAHEILTVPTAVSNLIREGKTFQIGSIMQTNRGRGMQTLNDALLALIRTGTIDADEARRKSNDPAALEAALRSSAA